MAVSGTRHYWRDVRRVLLYVQGRGSTSEAIQDHVCTVEAIQEALKQTRTSGKDFTTALRWFGKVSSCSTLVEWSDLRPLAEFTLGGLRAAVEQQGPSATAPWAPPYVFKTIENNAVHGNTPEARTRAVVLRDAGLGIRLGNRLTCNNIELKKSSVVSVQSSPGAIIAIDGDDEAGTGRGLQVDPGKVVISLTRVKN